MKAITKKWSKWVSIPLAAVLVMVLVLVLPACTPAPVVEKIVIGHPVGI